MNTQPKQSNLLELVDACETYHFNSGDPDDDIRLLKAQELRELGFISMAETLEVELNRKIKLSRIENEKYIAISDEMIQKFLNKKASLYDADHKPKLEAKPKNDDSILEFTNVPSPDYFWGNTFNDPYGLARQLVETDEVSLPLQQETRNHQLNRRQLQQVMRDWNSLPDILSAPMTLWERQMMGTSPKFVAKTCDFLKTEEGTIGKYEWNEEKISDYKGIPPENVLEVLKEHKDKQLFDYFTIASVNAVKDPLLLGRIEGIKERFFIAQWGVDVSLDDIL